MNMLKKGLTLSLCVGVSFANVALGQDSWPSKPVTLVVPFPPGGPTDLVARAIASSLSQSLKQTLVVENKAGANGTIGSAFVARAPADGYTLLYNTSSLAISPALYSNLNFDPKVDYAPISTTVNIPLVLLTHGKSDVKTYEELVASFKESDQQLSYGSAGQGNVTHLGTFLFLQEVGAEPQHIPYRGSAPAMVDLVGGQIDFIMNTLNDSVPFVNDKRLIPLAITSAERQDDVLPNVPTLSEKLDKELVVGAWQGIVAPKNTPQEIVNILNKEINDILQSDSFKELAKKQGFEILGSTAEEYQDFIDLEVDRWVETVTASGMQKIN